MNLRSTACKSCTPSLSWANPGRKHGYFLSRHRAERGSVLAEHHLPEHGVVFLYTLYWQHRIKMLTPGQPLYLTYRSKRGATENSWDFIRMPCASWILCFALSSGFAAHVGWRVSGCCCYRKPYVQGQGTHTWHSSAYCQIWPAMVALSHVDLLTSSSRDTAVGKQHTFHSSLSINKMIADFLQWSSIFRRPQRHSRCALFSIYRFKLILYTWIWLNIKGHCKSQT